MSSITVADNAPLFILLNAASGHNDTAETCAVIEEGLKAAGREHVITATIVEMVHMATGALKTMGVKLSKKRGSTTAWSSWPAGTARSIP